MIKHCTTCDSPIPKSLRIDGKKRNLRNRTKCLDCQPFGTSSYKPKTTDEKRSAYALKSQQYYQRMKEKFNADPISLLRTARKNIITSLINDSCQICGYAKCTRNLTFHHLRDKTTGLSSREFQFAFNTLINELKKCVVICHNCHGEVHDNLIPQELIDKLNSEFIDKLNTLSKKDWPKLSDLIPDQATGTNCKNFG